MATDPRTPPAEATMDPASLYREEIYTDRQIGTLRVLVPVTADGAPDASRATVYTGDAQIMTNMGPIPISFDIEATNLRDAIAGYADAAQVGIERTMKQLQELRRQQQSSLIVPPAGAASALGALGPGGLPGGGKIQLP
jgi:hypothetical protein